MFKNTFIIFTVLCLTTVLISCRSSEQPAVKEKKKTEYLDCAGVKSKREARKISLQPLTLVTHKGDAKINGIKSAIVKIGVLAGIHDTTPETTKNIHFFLEQFKSKQVQAIAIVGGVGRTENEIFKTLMIFSKVPIPVLVSPGAQESFAGFRAAMAKLNAAYPQFVDLTLVRRVFMKHVCLLSLPGYYNPFYLEAEHLGCSYDEESLAELKELIPDKGLSVLLSASPPLGKTRFSVDMGRGGVNIGDPDLSKMLVENDINFGVFGHVFESGGNASSKDISQRVEEKIWHPNFYLQTGSASALPVKLVNDGRVAGMAHIVEFSGKKGKFTAVHPNY